MISADQIGFGVIVSSSERDEVIDDTFANLDAVLDSVAARHAGVAPSVRPIKGRDRIDIVAISQAQGAVRAPESPRYHFFIDPLADQDANGSHESPWPSLDAALQGVSALREAGALRLDRGESLRLSVRE